MNARGYAIAAVLLIGSVVMTVAIRVSSHSMGNSKSATSQLNRLRTREASLSGIEIGRWLLEKDPRETDGDTDEWARTIETVIGDVKVSIQISDEQARLNASKLVHESGELNKPLWMVAQGTFPEFRSYANDIESFLKTRQSAQSGSLLSPGQLRRAPGLSDSDAPSGMTVFGNGLININSAEARVLEALFRDHSGSELSRRIIVERSRLAFRSVFDMKERMKLSADEFRSVFPMICVNSSWFRIRIDGEIARSRLSMEAIVQRTGESTQVVRFREWSR